MCNAGVLFVHGIQGSPSQFDFLLRRLPDSVKVNNLLLPGHGETIREFRNSGSAQWLPAVKEAAQEMKSQCDRLYFVGHSMGCLLGLLTENEMPGTFSGMLLLCCPFFVQPTLRYLRNNTMAVLPERKDESPYVHALRKANSVSAQFAGEYLTAVNPYRELFRLIRLTKQIPGKPECEVCFFFSEKDEIVSRKSAAYAKEKYGPEVEMLRLCGHDYFTPKAEAVIGQRLQKLISAARLG